jgi:uncharacterized protein (TIGR00251 family)
VATPTARLQLRVAPGARRSAVVGRHGPAWKVRVAAAPERGRANEALVDLLAGALGLKRPDVRVVAGGAARDKVVEIAGMTQEEAERRLGTASGAPARDEGRSR